MTTQVQSTIAASCKLNYFDPGENSNKVWIAIAYRDGRFETQYGRVREGSRLAISSKQLASQSAAVAELQKKRNEKLRKGYQETATIEEGAVVAAPVDLKTVATNQIQGCEDTIVRSLIEYLSEVNIHNITSTTSITYSAGSGTFQTPLGVLTPAAIVQARQLLRSIAAGCSDRN